MSCLIACATAHVKCQDFNLTNNFKELRSYGKGSSIRIEYVLYNRCSRGNVHIEGKKVTAAPGNSFNRDKTTVTENSQSSRSDTAALLLNGPGSAFLPAIGKLVLTSVDMGSTLTIGSNSTFLCFNKGGRLVNKRRMSRRKSLCEFRELMRDNYSTFQSVYNDNWYIGFNSTGKPMRGRKTRGRKMRPHKWFPFMFLKRRMDVPWRPFPNVSEDKWYKLWNDTSTNKS
ncbi:hypothetical protein MTO96_013200 [Rhipicephalus appendiculatus]